MRKFKKSGEYIHTSKFSSSIFDCDVSFLLKFQYGKSFDFSCEAHSFDVDFFYELLVKNGDDYI